MTRHSRSAKAIFLAGLLAAAAYFGINPRGHRPAPPETTPASRASETRPATATTSDAAAAVSTTTSPAPSAADAPLPESAPPAALAPVSNASLEAAVARVEEKRGGSETLDVPEELRHYDDRRRFLAVQVAASREDNL